MPDFSNGKIYRLVSTKTEKVYVGSTTNELKSRLLQHKKCYKKDSGVSSKHITCFDDCKIVLVEAYPCNNKYELECRERYWIEHHDCVNIRIPTRTSGEHYRDNRERILKYKREKIKCECGCFVSRRHIAEHRQTEKHRKLLEKKEQKLAYKREKVECECGCLISRRHIARHRKTKKHERLLTMK